jgi:hypothetical protein
MRRPVRLRLVGSSRRSIEELQPDAFNQVPPSLRIMCMLPDCRFADSAEDLWVMSAYFCLRTSRVVMAQGSLLIVRHVCCI